MTSLLSFPGSVTSQQTLRASEPTLCCYQNKTHQLQVVRISNIPNWYFERVVFPQQSLLFEAPLEALLEIYTGGMATAVLEDRRSCERLQVDEFTSMQGLFS